MVAAGRPSPPRSLPGAAAPVGERLRLVRLDDAAADFAGLGEQLLQLVALAPADGPLQVAQVLAEALQHLQHRLAVVQEDVAPHDRVGAGDTGEVPEAAGRDRKSTRLNSSH